MEKNQEMPDQEEQSASQTHNQANTFIDGDYHNINQYYEAAKGDEIDSLEELIKLAEEISKNVEIQTRKMWRNRLLSYLSMSLTLIGITTSSYFLSIQLGNAPNYDGSTGIGFLIGLILLLISIICYYTLQKERSRLKSKVSNDESVLNNLIIMIHEFKSSVYSRLDNIVKKAVFDIRINRIEAR